MKTQIQKKGTMTMKGWTEEEIKNKDLMRSIAPSELQRYVILNLTII
jgi:hypothetical protein